MPKDLKSRVHRTNGAAYHRHNKRHNKRQVSSSPKHCGRVRASCSGVGDCKFSLQPSAFREDHGQLAETKSTQFVNSRETSLGDSLAKSPSSGEFVVVGTTADKTGTPEAATQSLCDILNPTSPHSSEASTIPDKFDDSILAEASPNARLEEFEFEFENVVQIDGDQCQVRWADSIIRDSDLRRRYLHGRLLLEYVGSSVPLGRGLSKVMWELTWEPFDILRWYTDVVQRESQFEFGDVSEEQGGNSLVQWESSVIHESTIETLGDHPLLKQVQSLSYPLAHGYSVIAWKPMWVPTHIMEAYGGTD